MSIEDFFNKIQNHILGWESESYPDKWSKCTVYLSDRHFSRIQSLTEVELKRLVLKTEHEVVAHMSKNNQCYDSVLGTTKVELIKEKQAVVIDGSFSVTERLVCWIIEKHLDIACEL